MTTPRDIEDMTDAQDEAPERIWADRISDDIKGFVDWSEGEWSSSPFDGGTPYVRADLARAKIDRLAETCGYAISQWEDWVRDQLEGTSTFAGAMAEIEATRAAVRSDLARPSQAGVIRPLCWIDDTESKCTRAYAPALGGKMMVVELDPGSGEYSAGIDLSGLCFRFVLDTYHDGLGAFTAPAKFPSIEAAKSAAQADYEARVSSSLVETVGVEALVSFARPFADALDIECDFMTPPAPFEDGFDVRRRARAALAAMDTPKGGGDE